MESFNQLLNRYVQRLGLSDAELARAVGVSRQTIFRWREGTTGRPRHREDVLAIANKLRLTPAERDTLLLAAGFQPESIEPGAAQRSSATVVEIVENDMQEAESAVAGPPTSLFHKQWAIAAVGVLLLIGLVVWWLAQGPTEQKSTPTPTGQIVSILADIPTPAPATADETLVLVTHFANYAGSQIGYNVAGRLAEALQREVTDTRLPHIRITIWPEAVGERGLALRAGQTVSATLVIYGEYDVGRVLVKFAHPADQSEFADPAVQQQVLNVQDLSATINTSLPDQVRSLALMALGQIYLNQGDMDQAQLLLIQARNYLQENRELDEQTWALLNFYLGVAYYHSDPPDLDEAIAAYTESAEVWPDMVASRLNRIAAYEDRNQPGDLELALADADALIAVKPNWALAYNNRASIRLARGGTEDVRLALVDLERTIELDPTLPEAYLNQAHAHLAQGLSMKQVAPDLQKALELRSDYGNALNLLCWGYSVEQRPEQALPYCEQAIAADPDPLFYDSRGLTYALLADFPAAIADFQTYADWLVEQSDNAAQMELARRQAWIELLQAGQNPFTPQLLAELRGQFGQ